MIAETEQRTPDLPLRIIAGNHRQAEDWARREQLRPSSWRYVPDVASLHGIRNVRIVWIGTFWDRRDFQEISTFVDHSVSRGLSVVDRNEVKNKGSKTRTKDDTETGPSSGKGTGAT